MQDAFFENNSYSVAFAERRSIGEEWNHVKWNNRHHQIGCHRLYLLTEGSAVMRLYDGEIELVPNRVYFVPAFSVRDSSIVGEMNKYYIHFQSDSTVLSLYRYLSGKYSVEANELSEYLFKTVVDNYADPSLGAHFRVRGALDMLLADFISELSAERMALSRFEGVLRYIDENYRSPITLSELAALMNISTMYFSNYFKETFHVSPKQYILNKRLAESQRLLLESRMSIKEIAYSVGFENENYFSEFFSQKLGISAMKFRKRELPKTRSSIL